MVIVGGGLAGLTAAIHLSKRKLAVLVIEKNTYPNHKVCGEYVSNEVKPYLESLGVPLNSIVYADIDTLEISTVKGRRITTKLPLGGFGISRHAFDDMLYKTAKENGASFLFESVVRIDFHGDDFLTTTSNHKVIKAKWVIGAHGKRSNMDKVLNREFITRKSPWLGVKCHYKYDDLPSNLVALHNFKGGYGGLSRTEEGAVNFCYLASFESFQKHKNIQRFNAAVVSKNPFLYEFLKNAIPLFEQPLSIAQISFEQKQPIAEHVLMCGDSAGLIHPLCGNGMAMAINAARMASECILKSGSASRQAIEKEYQERWAIEFNSRLWTGRQLQKLLMSDTLSNIALNTITKSEKLLHYMIARTHGKPILV